LLRSGDAQLSFWRFDAQGGGAEQRRPLKRENDGIETAQNYAAVSAQSPSAARMLRGSVIARALISRRLCSGDATRTSSSKPANKTAIVDCLEAA
jgi:hypothetical protein